jgi:hypothetical protein
MQEQLWRWKELEDLRGERMRRQVGRRSIGTYNGQ